MQLVREIFDGGNDAGRRPVYGLADNGEAAIANSFQTAPARPGGENIEIILRAFGVGLCEYKIIGLKANHFFETHLRPILRRINDGGGTGKTQRIRDESGFAHRNQRIRPNDEEYAARRQTTETLVEVREVAFEIGSDGGACFRSAEYIGEVLGRRDDFLNCVRIGGKGRNAQIFEERSRFRGDSIW